MLGVATELSPRGIALQGFDAVLTGNIPLGGGMSSSAALEVATVHACALFSHGQLTLGEHDATFSPMQVAQLCQRAEQRATGVLCGILDQAAVCLAMPGKALLLDCSNLTYRSIPFDFPAISVVVIDTGVRRELAAVAYNERVRQSQEAVTLLRGWLVQDEPDHAQHRNIQTLRDVSPAQFAHYQDRLPALLRRRAGYVLAENARVLQVVELLKQGHIEQAGTILWQGHAGLRDEYEVSCAELDALAEIARQIPSVLGARMMGGGFGGCTINLVRNDAVEPLRQFVAEQYPLRCPGYTTTMIVCRGAAAPGYRFVD
jgi:galactokinase